MKKYFYFTCWATLFIVLTSAWLPAQVIFRDDFNRTSLGSDWIAPAYTDWSIVDGKAYNFVDGVNGTLTTFQSFSQTAYVIETLAMDFRSNYQRQYGIVFGKPDPNEDFGYILKYEPYQNRGISLNRSEGNEFFPVTLDDSLLILEVDKAYTFKIERYANGLLKVFINDGSGYSATPVLQATDTTYPELGHFGWRVDTETIAEPFYVDWIEARNLANNLFTNISATSGKTYSLGTVAAETVHYTDRSYTFTSVPAYLSGAAFIKTANEDKTSTATSFLRFELTQEAHLYVFYDTRATVLPDWLQDWVKLPDQVGTTDPGTSYMNVYTRTYGPGTVTLGANLAAPAAGSQMNYLVAAVPTMPDLVLQAEEATLTGAVVAANHTGYGGAGFVDYVNDSNDAVTWSFEVPVAGYYQLAFKYALLSGARPLEVKVNGAVVDASLSFPATGAWNTWNLMSTSAILKAGLNTVTLRTTGSNGPNMDYLQVDAGGNAVLSAGGRVAAAGDAEASNTALRLGNYPNPARSNTTIWYELPEASPVHLAVFDGRGRRVAVLVNNEWQDAGKHEKTLEIQSLSSGVYFYQLRRHSSSQVGKLVIEK